MPWGIVPAQGCCWSVITMIWETKQMKQKYRKPVALTCPDQGAGFVIVEAVIVAETGSSCYNVAFVQTQDGDAGTSLMPLRQTGAGCEGLTCSGSCSGTHVQRRIPKAQRRRAVQCGQQASSPQCLQGLPHNHLQPHTQTHTHTHTWYLRARRQECKLSRIFKCRP